MAWYWIVCLSVCILLGILIIRLLVLVFVGANYICYPKQSTYEEIIKKDIARGLYTEQEIRMLLDGGAHFTIKISEGYELAAIRFLCSPPEKSRYVIIIAHGIGCNLAGSLKYANLFLSLGFDCVVYDHRFHGKSGGTFCTLGGLERRDLLTVADTVREMYGLDAVIGLHGESMGAATAMSALDSGFPFAFCIEDCGFRSLSEQIRDTVGRNTWLFRKPAAALVKYLYEKRTGVSMASVEPVSALRSEEAARIPVLFIHGEADSFVPYGNLRILYDAKRGRKELYSVPGARHAAALATDDRRYRAVCKEFLMKNGVIPAI